MRTAWVLQGLGFLILITAFYIVIKEEKARAPKPEEVTSSNQTPMTATQNIVLRSPAFQDGQPIPSKYTCDGDNISPPLAIDMVPDTTVSLVLIMEDPDVPKNVREDGMWNHWVMFNMPPNTARIGEGSTPQGVAGVTTRNTLTYTGPCPPDRKHRYFFKVFALDTTLRLSAGASKEEVLEALKGHVLATGGLMGTYERQR